MRSLTFKLTLAFLVVSLAGIALVAALVWGLNALAFKSFIQDRGMNAYVTTVTSYYQSHSSWAGVEDYLHQQGLANSPDQQDLNNNNQPPPPFVLLDQNYTVLVDAGPFHPGETLHGKSIQSSTPVTVNNQVVGYVANTGRPPRPDPFEARYQASTNQALILAALGAVILAVLLGLLLARTITRPVRDLTAATSALAQGRLSQPVPVRSKDELGELTQSFNQMSTDLERSDNLRRQMTADIAHDLRTPLAVITGYLEGLKDGVLKPSPQRFTAMYDEALYLQRLVEDLRTLSLADSGELSINYQVVQPGELLDRLATSYVQQAEQNGIRLDTQVEADLPAIRVDPERMQQALGNLVSNALRYTPHGGAITLAARASEGQVVLEVKDSGAGIDPHVLPHVFERFYRGDDSRQEGGSGLGLAIAKSIVELQGGKISATSQDPGTGSQFVVQMPCTSSPLAA